MVALSFYPSARHCDQRDYYPTKNRLPLMWLRAPFFATKDGIDFAMVTFGYVSIVSFDDNILSMPTYQYNPSTCLPVHVD